MLPPGLWLDPDSGILSGTPYVAGTFTFTVTATDPSGAVATQSYTVTINPPLAITAATLPDGFQGQAYNQQVPTTGGVGPLNFTLDGGGLPPG